MKSLLALIIIVSYGIISSKAQNNCPVDSSWNYCGTKGSVCHINGDVSEGYISFGGNGKWTLIPFINMGDADTQLNVDCEENLGDITSTKRCCWIARRNGFLDLKTESWRGRKDEGQTFTTPTNTNLKHKTYTVIYGVVDRYIIRPVVNVEVPCTSAFFGDPGHGIQKKCNWKSVGPLPTRDSAQWTNCANEDENCDGLKDDEAYWIRFGSGTNKKYYFRMVISTTGDVPCTRHFFGGDPEPGQSKFCEKAAYLDFKDRSGRWELIQHCGGDCGDHEFEETKGVVGIETVEDSWSTTVTASFSASFAAGAATVSGSVANTVTQSQSSSFQQSVSVTRRLTCESDSFYGWVFEGEQLNGINHERQFQVHANIYYCTNNFAKPKCLPSYCEPDTQCQECKPGGTISALPPPLHEVYRYPNEVVFEPNGEMFDERPYALPIGVPSYIYSDLFWAYAFVFGCLVICCAAANILVVLWSNCPSRVHRSSPYSAVKFVASNDDLEDN